MGRIALRVSFAAVLAAAAAAANTGSSPAAVYWTSEHGIGRANLDGEAVEQSFIGPSFARFACGVAVGHAHVYWSDPDAGTIGRARIDGRDPDPSFITGADSPCGVAVDRAHVYWTNGTFDYPEPAAQAIGRANLDGSGVDQSFISSVAEPCGVTVDHAHVYWTNEAIGTISRAEIDGTGVEQSLIEGADSPCGLAVTGGSIIPRHAVLGGSIYWANSGELSGMTIGRASLDGSAAEQSFIDGLQKVWGVAVTGEHIFWSDAGAGVGRAALDGTLVERQFIKVPSVFGARGVAVDGTAVRISVGTPEKQRRRGTAVLRVGVPEAGLLELRRTGRVKADSASAAAAGETVVKVRARGRAQRRLERAGDVMVRAKLAFTPEGATAVTEKVALRLVER
jgi:hypothetical protein